MAMFLTSARTALIWGFVICAAILGIWLMGSTVDPLGLFSFLARFVHVLAGIVWVGMIWFVNFIQLAAVQEADDAGRAALMKLVVPRVAATFRMASHLTLASGVVLLVATGYLLDRWVFLSAVYIPPLKIMLLMIGVAAAVVMWVLAHMVIWPSLRILMGEVTADEAGRTVARNRVRTYARVNLMLAIPVTFVMVAAAHLY